MRSRILAKMEERCQGMVKNVKETRELSARILVEDIHGGALSGDSSDSDVRLILSKSSLKLCYPEFPAKRCFNS